MLATFMTGLFRPFFATCALFALGACARPPAGKPYPPSASLSEALVANATAQGHHHPHSLSNPEEVRVQHMGIAWEVDFDQKRLEGVVRYLISRPSPNAPLVLDTQGLEILSAFVSDGPPDLAAFKTSPNLMTQAPELEWRVAKWSLGSQDPMLGRPLAVHLEEHTRVVELRYRTTQASHGLQWLAPAQTDDGQAPFLYTQSQPILGRSFIPMQDTPAVRVTYDAKVKVPKELRALMSAQMQQHPPAALPPIQGTKREYTFNMPQAVPSYLIALAVGRLDYAPLGSRSGVWASPSQLAGAKRELAPVEDMITKTEALFGKYRWGQYDVLILPSAFPYGGMENPRVTFATPTILAKDGSLISLIAHELAHSWSGNLVTNANWNDIWLNEGFTTYAERRIVEAVYGKTRARMEAQLGYQDLQRGLEALKDNPQDQRLAADVTGRDPDLLLSAIAYEKGALFLTRLEEAYGREAFDKFIRAWFDDHAFGTATTPQFVEFLNKTLIDAAPLMPGQKPVDLSAWLHEPGLPKLAPNVQSEALRKIDEAYAGFAAKSMRLASLPYAKWSFQEQLHFLRKIDDKLDQAQFEGLERKYGLSRTGNSEIRAKWLELCAKRGYAPAKKSIEDFLISVGRRKFLMPIYTAIIEGPFGHGFAQAVFERAKAGYHAISRGSVEALLANKARS